LANEFTDRQHLTGIRNYVLDLSTETAFLHAIIDPPIPTDLPVDEQIRLAFENLRYVDWNAVFPLIYGFPADFDMSTLTLADHLPLSEPRNVEHARHFIENHYSAIGDEIVGTHNSGDPLAIVVSSTGIVENNCLVGLWTTMINRTALKNAESTLQKSEEKFSKAFQLSPDALVISKKSDGEIIDVNDGFTDLTGFSRDEVIGNSTVSLGFWNDPTQRQQSIKLLEQKGSIKNLEASFVTKSGETIACVTSAAFMVIDSEDCILSTTRALRPHEVSRGKT
jgi:PAS domain S-box-containing protein